MADARNQPNNAVDLDSILENVSCSVKQRDFGVLSTYSDETVDELVAKAGKEPDEEKRAKLLKQANARLHEGAPWIFLNRQYSVYGVSERVDWKPRLDEGIDADAMTPKANGSN